MGVNLSNLFKPLSVGINSAMEKASGGLADNLFGSGKKEAEEKAKQAQKEAEILKSQNESQKSTMLYLGLAAVAFFMLKK